MAEPSGDSLNTVSRWRFNSITFIWALFSNCLLEFLPLRDANGFAGPFSGLIFGPFLLLLNCHLGQRPLEGHDFVAEPDDVLEGLDSQFGRGGSHPSVRFNNT